MVSYFFSPNYSGSAVQALNLSRHLQRVGLEPFILSANLSGSAPRELVNGVLVFRVPVNLKMPIATFWWSAARFLWQHRHHFDLIHAHGTLQHGVVSLMGKLLRKPTILKVAMAGSDIAFERQGRVGGAVLRFAVKRFTRYIATADAIAGEFEFQRLDTGRVRRIPNGVDTEIYAPVSSDTRNELRRTLGLPPGPLVTCVAIVQERKNIDGALRIWRSVVEQGGAGHLAIIGPVEQPEGPFFRSLQEFVDTHGLRSRVSFLGSRDPVAPFLKASEVFLFPSKKEGMANAVLEAMACAVPCLVSKAAGFSSVIRDGVNGLTFDPHDEAAFATGLLTLLTDESLRARMGNEARQRVMEEYSLDTIARRYQDLYEELVPSDRRLPSISGGT